MITTLEPPKVTTYKSIGYGYPTSTHAVNYWTSRGERQRARNEGVWFVCKRRNVIIDSILSWHETQDEVEIAALKIDLPWSPLFINSTLNRIVAR